MKPLENEVNKGYKRLPKDSALLINFEPYVVHKSKESGEKDLIKLANEFPYEGSWFYTPRYSDWSHISVDHKEKVDEDGGITFSSISRQGRFKLYGEELVHYHTHPKKMYEIVLEDLFKKGNWVPRLDEQTTPIIKKIILAKLYFRYSFPSEADVVAYVDLQKQMKKNNKNLIGRIASPIGIMGVEILQPDECLLYKNKISLATSFNRIQECNVVRFNPRRSGITIDTESLVESVNKEMEGIMRFSFSPIVDCLDI